MNNVNIDCEIPDDLILFISGVPGVGKTTISYELLKILNVFRIIEETDLIREILRGYNDFIKDEFKDKIQFLFDKIDIIDRGKILSIDEAKQQCIFIKKSIENIVARQQRKGIPSIINGVHIIPEILDGLAGNHNIIYINLYINNETEIYNRLLNRNPDTYMLDHISFIYQNNIALYLSTLKLSEKKRYVFNNIDVTNLTIKDTINEIIGCIKHRIQN